MNRCEKLMQVNSHSCIINNLHSLLRRRSSFDTIFDGLDISIYSGSFNLVLY